VKDKSSVVLLSKLSRFIEQDDDDDVDSAANSKDTSLPITNGQALSVNSAVRAE